MASPFGRLTTTVGLVLVASAIAGRFGTEYVFGHPQVQNDDWSKVVKSLQVAVAGGMPSTIEQAALEVAADDSRRAVEVLVKALAGTNTTAYWPVIRALSKLSSAEAIDALVREVSSNKAGEVRRDLVFALRMNSKSAVVDGFVRILKEGPLELQAAVVDDLVDRDARSAVPDMIAVAIKHASKNGEIVRRVFKALRAFASEDPPNVPAQWLEWWKTKEAAGTGKGGMEPARGPGKTVVETVRRFRVTDFEDLRKSGGDDFLVVEGRYDTVQEVLAELKVPCTVRSFDDIRQPQWDLSKHRAIIVNCGSADWPKQQADRIRRYVEGGGYLFVTDLGLIQLVKAAFPGFVDNSKGTFTDMTVGIVPWRGASLHPLLRGVGLHWEGGGYLQWKIDDQGPSISFDPRRVVPLIEAPELIAKRRPPAVAVTFAPGADPRLWQESVSRGGIYEELQQMVGGKVVCVLSHFSKQKQGEDGFALQNLLLNFLIEAKDRALMRAK